MNTDVLTLSPTSPITCRDVFHVAFADNASAEKGLFPRVEISAEALSAMRRSEQVLEEIVQRGDAIYGLTTGFGALARYAGAKTEERGISLIAHLGAGFGENIEPEIVRGAMLARLQTLVMGFSGITAETARFYAALLNDNIVAAVPSVGSLGASGDLIPLTHIARVMTGEGEVLCGVHGEANSARLYLTKSAREALKEKGYTPHKISNRDALALVNGTSFSAAYLALAIVRSQGLMRLAEEMTAWQMLILRCRRSSLKPRLHEAKRHRGQIASAASIEAALKEISSNADSAHISPDFFQEDDSRTLQEIYSIRCTPQILGAVREVLTFAESVANDELNGADDNPLIDAEQLEILHGGNFMTQHIAFAADALNSALTQAANLAERQIEAIVNPAQNAAGLSLLLSAKPGISTGMAGVQLTATAILAEMRAHRQGYGSSSLPTNAGNQDIVPLGLQAARELYHQTERFAALLACQALCLAQAAALKNLPSLKPAWMLDFEKVEEDRALRKEIERLAQHLLVFSGKSA